MSAFGWPNQSSYSGNVWMSSSSGTTIQPYIYMHTSPPAALPSVAEAVEGPLGDREWLDAQVAEVCDLAEAA